MVAIFMPRGLPAGRALFKRAVQDKKKPPDVMSGGGMLKRLVPGWRGGTIRPAFDTLQATK
jgi:hypothetical protein